MFLNVRYGACLSRAPRCGGIRYKCYRRIIAKRVAINNYFGTRRDGLLFPVSTSTLPPVSVFSPLVYVGLKSSLTPLPTPPPPALQRPDVLMEDWSQCPHTLVAVLDMTRERSASVQTKHMCTAQTWLSNLFGTDEVIYVSSSGSAESQKSKIRASRVSERKR